MKEVTLEIATILRQKGFEEDCAKYYLHDGTLCDFTESIVDEYGHEIMEYNTMSSCNRHKDLYAAIDAPLIEQVLEWLRVEKKIYVHAYYVYFIDEKTGKENSMFFPVIQRIGVHEKSNFANNQDFSTWEEAILDGIKYTILYLL